MKEMITYFKDKNHKSKKQSKKYKTTTKTLKSFDTIVIIATTFSSITLSVIGIGLTATPISAATACGLSIGNKVIYEIVMQKYNKYKKPYDKDQQTIKSFDKLIRKSLRNIAIDENEYESLCKIFLLSIGMKRELNLFCRQEHKNRIKYF